MSTTTVPQPIAVDDVITTPCGCDLWVTKVTATHVHVRWPALIGWVSGTIERWEAETFRVTRNLAALTAAAPEAKGGEA